MALTAQELAELQELKAAVQELGGSSSDTGRITTREQAQARAMEVENQGQGFGAEDLIADMVNPLEAPIAVAKFAKAGGSALRNFLTGAGKQTAKAAEKQGTINAVKQGTAGSIMQKELSGAADTLGARIGGKEEWLQALIHDVDAGKIDPETVKQLAPELYEKLAARRTGTPFDMRPQLDNSVPISAKERMGLKREMDNGNWSQSDAQNPLSTPKAPQAANIGDSQRDALYKIPGVRQTLADQGADIRLKKFITRRADKNPLGMSNIKPGQQRFEIAKKIDSETGSNIVGAAKKVTDAKESLIKPSDLLSMKAIPTVVKMGGRAATAIGSAADNVGGIVSGSRAYKPATDLVGFAAAKGVTNPLIQATPAAPQWSQQDEDELNELKSQLQELSK